MKLLPQLLAQGRHDMRFGFGPFSVEQYGNVGLTEAYEIMGDAVELAENTGFDSAWIAERHFSEDGYCSAAFVAAANLAARTESIRIGVMPILGLSHPLYFAEDAAVLDNLSGGRAIICPINAVAHEIKGYGISEADYLGRFTESLDVLFKAWGARPFRADGKIWTIPAQLEGHTENVSGMVMASPKPAQFDLPVWLGGFWEPGRTLAAELGLPMILGSISDNQALGSLWSAYDEKTKNPRAAQHIVVRDIYVSTADDPAAEVAPMLTRQFERYNDWGLWNGDPRDFETLARGRFIIGNPEQVIDQIKVLDDTLGIDHLLCRMHFPGMPLHQLISSMTLFSREVIPEFRMSDLPRQIRVGV